MAEPPLVKERLFIILGPKAEVVCDTADTEVLKGYSGLTLRHDKGFQKPECRGVWFTDE